MNALKLSVVLENFVQHWNEVGGPSASLQDLLIDDFVERMTVVGFTDGDWRYMHNGRMHHQVNGVRIPLFSRVRDVVSPEIWQMTERRYRDVLQTQRPQYNERMGFIGDSRDLMTNSVRVPCKPVLGFDPVLVSVWEWLPELEAELDQRVVQLIERYRGDMDAPEGDPLVWPMSVRLSVVRQIAEGRFGPVSSTDLMFIQLFELGLNFEEDI